MKPVRFRKKLIQCTLAVLLFTYGSTACAQDPTDDDLPPDPGQTNITVNKIQDLHFGAFSVTGGGGSVTVSSTGVRTASGSVSLLNLGIFFQQAIFNIEAPPGTFIAITYATSATLTGSSGGTASLQLGACHPASSFTTTADPPARTEFSLGGTLTIGSTIASPPGQYSGTFEIVVNYE